jgi:hypothetical protein
MNMGTMYRQAGQTILRCEVAKDLFPNVFTLAGSDREIYNDDISREKEEIEGGDALDVRKGIAGRP